MSSEIRLHPIGSIEVEGGRFYLSVEKTYQKALKELETFSHIHVLWWGNKTDSPKHRETLVINKPYKNSPDTVGTFATRSEVRPNPVLITAAAVICIDYGKGRVEIPWIDAEPGSPVIDIKPYHPCLDRVKDVQSPAWCADWPQWYEDSAEFDWTAVFNF